MSDRAEIFDFAKAALWPIIVLFAILLFYKPINSVVDSFSERADQIDKLKLGYLEISIRPQDLPKATKEIAEALSKFDEPMIRRMMFKPDGKTVVGQCILKDVPESIIDESALNRLVDFNLITVIKDAKPTFPCDRYYCADFTDIGIKTHEFLYSLIFSQVRRSTVANMPR